MHLRDPVLPVEAALCPPTFSYAVADDYKEEAKVRLQEAYTLVKENLQKCQQNQKERHDRAAKDTHFTKGDKIWLFTPTTKPGLSPKLTHNWHGPYEIIERLSNVTYRLQDPDHKSKTFTAHANRMKPYLDPNDRPHHDYIPDEDVEYEDETADDNGPIVKVLDMMWSRNDSKRLEKRYFVQFQNGHSQWLGENEIKDFRIVQDFIQSKK
ncbi:uncharacterized protein LOC134253110 [Saccostrea cucullata]|uniref:uncharacterized protein LOC134253110 n=1 Tax=Saccostrea cuccullata TaxID=36930 RepID=UPI002ED44F57